MRLKTQTHCWGRSGLLLRASLRRVVKRMRPALHVSKPVPPSGAALALPGSYHNVKMVVPAKAVKSEAVIDMSIRSDLSPSVAALDGPVVVSPVVQCLPRGMQFEQPVTIRLPHCSAGPLESLQVWCNSTEDVSSDAWVQITDVVERTPDWVEFRTNHFTMCASAF